MFRGGIVDHALSRKAASGETVQVKAEPVLQVSRGDYRESRGRYRSYKPGYRSRRGSCSRPWSSQGAEGGRNPPGPGGEPTKCFTCGSVDHWARECTKKEEASKEDQGEVQLTLLADCVDRREKLMLAALGSIVLDSGCSTTVCGQDWLQAYVDTLSPQEASEEDQGEVQLTLLADCVDRREKLMLAALGLIVLDSGCSTTVCGQDWLQAYVDTLSPQDVKLIKEETSETSFKFRDGKHVISKGKVHIPCYIHGVKIMICSDIRDCRMDVLMVAYKLHKVIKWTIVIMEMSIKWEGGDIHAWITAVQKL